MTGIVDVAVIGCGPVGALAANLLAGEGLSVVVIDRETAPHPLPRAVHLDHEMMRLFQAAGLVDRVRPAMRETDGHLHVGADRGVIRYMGTAGRPKPFGWANDYFFYQPELEALLRAGIARFPETELLLGTELVGLAQDADHVALRVRRDGVDSIVRARWIVACDGARSLVRNALDIDLDDLDFEEPWLVVDAEVDAPVRFPDLHGVPAMADLQQLSVMMCDPARPATIVPGRGNLRRWEFMLLPGENDAEMMRPERVAALLHPYLGGVPHRLLRAATYRFHGLIAERWRDRRVFLAGDAAHQTPPFFGQGMCHGMRDIANLAWKLGLVVRGAADERLLDSYQRERDPHVRSVVTAAVEAGRYICELDPAKAAARDAAMRARAPDEASGTAADLVPPYHEGVVANGTPGAGERFIQPWLSTSAGRRLLDDVVGGGWRLFAEGTAIGAAEDAISSCDPLSVAIVDVAGLEDGGALSRWLLDRGADAVLVRPDFYVFGTSADDAPGLLRAARDALRLIPIPEAVA